MLVSAYIPYVLFIFAFLLYNYPISLYMYTDIHNYLDYSYITQGSPQWAMECKCKNKNKIKKCKVYKFYMIYILAHDHLLHKIHPILTKQAPIHAHTNNPKELLHIINISLI